VARQKDDESDEVSWGEFLWVVKIGEHNVPYCWSFSGTCQWRSQEFATGGV